MITGKPGNQSTSQVIGICRPATGWEHRHARAWTRWCRRDCWTGLEGKEPFCLRCSRRVVPWGRAWRIALMRFGWSGPCRPGSRVATMSWPWPASFRQPSGGFHHTAGRGWGGNRDRPADGTPVWPERVPFERMGAATGVLSPRMRDLGHGTGQESGATITWCPCILEYAVQNTLWHRSLLKIIVAINAHKRMTHRRL